MRNDEQSLKLWNNVDRCRERVGLSLNDICRNTGIKIDRMKSWRTRLAILQADELYMIARTLDVSMEYLLTGENSGRGYNSRVRAIADLLTQDQDKLGAVEVLLFGKPAGQSSAFSKNA